MTVDPDVLARELTADVTGSVATFTIVRPDVRNALSWLHRERLIFYQADGQCLISPKGLLAAEQILLKSRLASVASR